MVIIRAEMFRVISAHFLLDKLLFILVESSMLSMIVIGESLLKLAPLRGKLVASLLWHALFQLFFL